jgi:DNA polymerase-3 subunit gamma/tau
MAAGFHGGLAGPPATTDCEPGQARKGAAAAVDSCAGVWLAKVPTSFSAAGGGDGERVAARGVQMSYQVLARKWRPRTFAGMVGQGHVLRALINALDSNRLHHAFLFTGTRGVGKTTVSRIFAKSLNCEQGISSTPCGECDACVEIDGGRFVDLIEVDAASRTRVDDTRELLENLHYPPARGRFKVYLIDEVHMLSTHSFNALLKTLEEPPDHVKFLFATTDPQKLPPTILSRCLQFNLRRLESELIGQHMARLLEEEGIEGEPPALALLAHAADGSMRDGLSLLDQAIAFGGGAVGEEDVRAMLGTLDRTQLFNLAEALQRRDGRGVLEAVDSLVMQGGDPGRLLHDLLSLLQQIAMLQLVPDYRPVAGGEGERLGALARGMSAEEVQLYYQIALIGRRDLPYAPDPRSGVEMVLLRMLAFHPGERISADSGADPSGGGGAMSPPPTTHSSTEVGPEGGGLASGLLPRQLHSAGLTDHHSASVVSDAAGEVVRPGGSPPVAAAGSVTPGVEGTASNARSILPRDPVEWGALIERMGLRGAARELAAHSVVGDLKGVELTLFMDDGQGQMRIGGAEGRLREALAEWLDIESLRLRFADAGSEGAGSKAESPARYRQRQKLLRHHEALEAIESDPHVRSLQEVLGARFSPDQVVPLNGVIKDGVGDGVTIH